MHLLLFAIPAAAASGTWPWDSASKTDGGDYMDRYIAESGGRTARASSPAEAVPAERETAASFSIHDEKAASSNLHDEMEKIKAAVSAERRGAEGTSDDDSESKQAAPEQGTIADRIDKLESEMPRRGEFQTSAEDERPVSKNAAEQQAPKIAMSVPMVTGGTGNVVSVRLASELQRAKAHAFLQ